MKTKTKPCSRCSKDRPIFKNKTIDGEKKQFCSSCWNIVNKEVAKEKRKKAREKKREVITEKKLDAVTSRLVRSIYPLMCHGCGCQLEFNTAQSGHFFGRQARSVRFSIQNQLPVCKYCNFYDQTHVYQLGKWLDIYWGEGTAERIRQEGRESFKPSPQFKKELYELYLNPPQADTLEQTRQLILKEYLKIKG